MNDYLFGIKDLDIYLVMGILVLFALLELVLGRLVNSKRSQGDWVQEVGSFLVLPLMTKPLIVAGVYLLGNVLVETPISPFSGWSLWLALPVYLLIDDLLQYIYHRAAHETPFLWKLHRTHHQAEEMGFLVSYRNAWLYYVLMPNIWWMGLVTLWGGGLAVAIGLVLKQLVIISSHSSVHWDAPLYKVKALRPLIFVLERTIVTPAFHHSHHGKSKKDGISDPNGNFGNMFSIWDQLLGTATFPHAIPTDLGLENDPKEHWSVPVFWPFVASKDGKSELSRQHLKPKTTSLEPATVELEKGKSYLWCQCGRSKNQPFCDGSHQGTKYKPLLFKAEKTGRVKLCNCKLTNGKPFCDGSHKKGRGEGQ